VGGGNKEGGLRPDRKKSLKQASYLRQYLAASRSHSAFLSQYFWELIFLWFALLSNSRSADWLHLSPGRVCKSSELFQGHTTGRSNPVKSREVSGNHIKKKKAS
jgi:hypothetical protein